MAIGGSALLGSLHAVNQRRTSNATGSRSITQSRQALPWVLTSAARRRWRAERRGENPMPPGHGTSQPCRTPLGCFPGAEPGCCPARERPKSQPSAAPRLFQPLGNIAPQISQRRPRTLQNLDALDPQLTPTALRETHSADPGNSRCAACSRHLSTPHSRCAACSRHLSTPLGLYTPTLQQSCRAVRQLQLSSLLETQGAPDNRGQWHQQNDVDAETIRPVSREFPLSRAGNQGPPVPPARPRQPCGPGFGSDRWWRCAPSRKSRHGPPAG